MKQRVLKKRNSRWVRTMRVRQRQANGDVDFGEPEWLESFDDLLDLVVATGIQASQGVVVDGIVQVWER